MNKQQKAELLKNILKGVVSIYDSEPKEFDIEMWDEDPNDSKFLINMKDPTKRMSKADYMEREKTERNTTFVSLNLNL